MYAQGGSAPLPSADDATPAVLLHLPDLENVRSTAAYAGDRAELERVAGHRPELSAFEFTGGVEAATAVYPVGRLVIVEFPTPQASVFADEQISSVLSPQTTYRRIGNYSVFVFDTADAAAANALLDQVKYQKYVQWLGAAPEMPTKAERDFTITTAGVFLSTFYAISIGITLAAVLGISFGIIFFLYRQKERSRLTTFSDAGGMTRLNLDGLTPEIVADDGVALLK